MLDLIDEKDAFAQISPAPQAGLFCRTGVRYEVALDVMGAMISHYAEAIGRARSQANPDADVVDLYQALQAEIRNQRDALDPKDFDAIETAIAHYGQRAKAVFSESADADQNARRAHFLHANASLALEGFVMDSVDRAIQEQIAIGAISADEAVALLRQFSTH